ncbi:carbon dioxide concentrating mechanism protein [Clostridium putrefaciens]|uniref:Carbon dioxide concentrating mechanism protein n=1 Tax=Clostridium putrefaciens TaxID=99675 RepID=A0A381J9V4_9CLOT|nr:BMC domain-containing protein [Clostridium putrefaciens]SUY48034.1 carbon dioxide concentrating mechanism protein [Clostridium putrefaciens]
MKKSTLGFLETYGFVAAVEGLDVALKSANVELVSCEFISSGIVTVVITGDVSSVKAAVEAACAAIDRIGILRNAHVIARADDQVLDMFYKDHNDQLEDLEKENIHVVSKVQDITETVDKSNKIDDLQKSDSGKANNEEKIYEPIKEAVENKDGVLNQSFQVEEIIKMSEKQLEALKVQELRTAARILKEQHKFSLTKKQIKFSKKDELIKAILNEK